MRILVKIQIPTMSTLQHAPAFVYDEKKAFRTFLHVTPELSKKMKGRLKAYFWAECDSKNKVVLGDEAPLQSW
jgi:hypothetical protein